MVAERSLRIRSRPGASGGHRGDEITVEHHAVDTFERPKRRSGDRHATREILEHLERRDGVRGRCDRERDEADVEALEIGGQVALRLESEEHHVVGHVLRHTTRFADEDDGGIRVGSRDGAESRPSRTNRRRASRGSR